MTPPREFVSALRSFDADLRIRWQVRTKLWAIERKMPPRLRTYLAEQPPANPWSGDRSLDLFDGWRDGYVHVMNVHPSLLDHRVFAHLAEADAWRKGGMTALVDQIEEEERQREAAFERERHNFHEAAGKDLYDTIAWDEGRRVSLHEPAEPAGEAREGYVVVDRRVIV
jgi:hypothetical protein